MKIVERLGSLDRVGGVALLVFAAAVAIETRVLPLGSHRNPGPGYLPLGLALFLVALAVVLIVFGRPSPRWTSVRWPEKYHAAAIIGCCFFATFGIEALGYRLTMIAILAFLFSFLERMQIWLVLLLAVALPLASFYVFDSVLRVPLPRGGFGF